MVQREGSPNWVSILGCQGPKEPHRLLDFARYAHRRVWRKAFSLLSVAGQGLIPYAWVMVVYFGNDTQA